LSDEILAKILDDWTRELREGRPVDVDAAARRHPKLEAELRELWGTLRLAEEIGRSASRGKPGDLAKAETVDDASGAPGGAAHPPPAGVGEYEILEELGRGGMGVVYKARKRGLERTVALKMLLRGAHASAADMARFRSEVESASQLEHPNIAPVYDVGSSNGEPYFTMRFIEGTTLARKLAGGPMAPQEAARILASVASGVHFAHEHGVLHRDLKPQNILIDSSGTPYVTDFGLAKRLEGGNSITQSGAILGTPSYMAPEQAAGNRGQMGPAADVYSLGAILYHALTGRPPHQAATPVDTVLSVLEQDPLPPRLLNPRVNRDLEMIALKCLQKPQDLRYPSAEALAKDLTAYLSGEPISARSTSLRLLVGRFFRDTPHAPVLENWGLLWMWHAVVVIALCTTTNLLHWVGIESPGPYLGLWMIGFGTWAAIFWALRRRAGPITFVEKQIAHVWGGSVLASTSLFLVEIILGLEVLALSPVLALLSGMVFFVKAGILSGTFYVQAFFTFATAPIMAFFPRIGLTIFGLVTAVCFFVPGLKYHRQRVRQRIPGT